MLKPLQVLVKAHNKPSWAKEADFSCGDERSDCGRVFQLTTPVRQCPVGSYCAQAARPRSARMRARLRRTAPPIGQAGVLSVPSMPLACGQASETDGTGT